MFRKFYSGAVFVLLAIFLMSGVLAYAQNPTTFQSTQFNVIEESEKARAILANFDGEAAFVTTEEGPLLELLKAEGESGSGSTDVVGALHGTFPTLVNEDLMFDLSELTAKIDAEYNIADAFAELGKMGTTDYQYYVPWMQATYIMAANEEALAYLPEGADINALTWQQLADWGKNIKDATGEAKLGFPIFLTHADGR